MHSTFDTHELIKSLVKQNFTEGQAEVLAKAVAEVKQADFDLLVTKKDLEIMKRDIIITLGGMLVVLAGILVAILPLVIHK